MHGFGYTSAEVDLQCRIMINFYNYLMIHNVCPDFIDDLMAARRVCERAKYELPAISAFAQNVLGDIVKSCSVLFGGYYAEAYGGNSSWAGYEATSNPGITAEKARFVLSAAIGALGSDEMFDTVLPEGAQGIVMSKLKFTKSEEVDLEVIKTEEPTTETMEFYASENKHQSKVALKPLGKLICKPWAREAEGRRYDLPPGVLFKPAPSQDQYIFWLEGETLKHAFVGMKLNATIQYLSFEGCDEGVWVLDAVSSVFCSFYTYILNELMRGPFKAPRSLSNEEIKAEEDGKF
jgi:hypothetical protein